MADHPGYPEVSSPRLRIVMFWLTSKPAPLPSWCLAPEPSAFRGRYARVRGRRQARCADDEMNNHDEATRFDVRLCPLRLVPTALLNTCGRTPVGETPTKHRR